MGHSYVDAFSKEWLIHRRTQLDSFSGTQESARAFYEKTGLQAEELKDKIVLDVGCGTGRFMEVVLQAGCKVAVGVDMSESAKVAQDNLRHYNRDSLNLDRVMVYQLDLHDLTFPDESFDIIYSIGVLHHTPDTKKAFLALLRLLKPGGIIAIWVYPDEPWRIWLCNRITGFYRVFTTRMPMGLLYKLCWLAIPLYCLRELPVFGGLFWLLSALLPISGHPLKEWRWLDTFDWYAPKYQHKHRWHEVVSWFNGAGLVNVRRNKVSISYRGNKEC